MQWYGEFPYCVKNQFVYFFLFKNSPSEIGNIIILRAPAVIKKRHSFKLTQV